MITAGDRFGNLIIVSCKGVCKRQTFWNCLCSCGSAVVRGTGQLNYGRKLKRIQACRNCSQRINKSKSLGESSWRILFNNYRSGASRRNLAFEISFEEFKNICSENCHYCKALPSVRNRYMKSDGTLISKTSRFTAERSGIVANGIDRKNNFAGYVAGNILPACINCNLMKGTLAYNDFIEHCGLIYHTMKDNKQ